MRVPGLCIATLLAALFSYTACAADLIIGRATEQSSIDPLFGRSGTNYSTSGQMFERLVMNDANNQLHPALAVSWRALDPTTWEIKLRDHVKFHDGSDFTAEDVVFSFERARNVPNSPASFAGSVASIVNMRALDRLTVQRLVMQRFAQYWGAQPDFEKVTLRYIARDASRLAALLAGDVDLIDEVSPDGAKQLKANSKVRVFSIGSTRLIYLALDSDRDQSPFVTDAAGKPIDRNPLKDARVRRALSLMIDRKVIVDRLLDGSGVPAGQMVPQGIGGFDPALTAPPHDLAAARKLLIEAGYPNGFGITLHTSVDRFARDSDLGPKFDAALKRAMAEFNDAKRNAGLQEATRIAFNDVAVVPLYWPVVHWAAEKGIAYEPRRDEGTLAQKASIAK